MPVGPGLHTVVRRERARITENCRLTDSGSGKPCPPLVPIVLPSIPTLNVEEAIVYAITVDSDECLACDNIATAPAHVAAYVYAEYPSGVTASFCAHHGREHMASLIEHGARIVDLSHLVHA